jgi:hypothetical protein
MKSKSRKIVKKINSKKTRKSTQKNRKQRGG